MANLKRHKQDETYFTVLNIGGFVTKQIHPDGVAYLKHCGVWLGDEIPSECMSVLREYGWLFTKGEVPYWGEVDWAPAWRSIRPRPLSQLTPYSDEAPTGEWDAAGVRVPTPSVAGIIEERYEEARRRVEQQRQATMQSINAEIEADLRRLQFEREERERKKAERERAEQEAERQRREEARARNRALQEERTKRRREAAAKGWETRRRNAEINELGRRIDSTQREPVVTQAVTPQVAAPHVVASTAAVRTDDVHLASSSAAFQPDDLQPAGRSQVTGNVFQRPPAKAWTPTLSYVENTPTGQGEPAWYTPEGRWSVNAWIWLLGVTYAAWVIGGWFFGALFVALCGYKCYGLTRCVIPILKSDPSHLMPWVDRSQARRDEPGYQQDRQLVALLVLVLAAAAIVVSNRTGVEWLGGVALIVGIWAACEVWRLRGV